MQTQACPARLHTTYHNYNASFEAAHRHTGIQADRQTERQTDQRTNIKTDRQTDRQTGTASKPEQLCKTDNFKPLLLHKVAQDYKLGHPLCNFLS